MSATSTSSGKHLAAILPSKGSPFEITHRPTPTPGPNEVLVAVKSVAINPIDSYQRYAGFVIDNYPAVIGSDVGGTIVSTGSAVSTDLKPGTRVSAFAPCFFKRGAPDYGAFQELVLIPAYKVTPLPDNISFNEASVLPVAVLTAWAGFNSIGLPLNTSYTPSDKKGILIWGGASSVGSAVVQIAKSLGFITYVTASAAHHEYLKTLGADKLFDYKLADVVDTIVNSAKEDGVKIQTGYDAVGRQLKEVLEVLAKAKGEGIAQLASAVPFTDKAPKADEVENIFVASPTDEAKPGEFAHFVFRTWLKEKLEKGEFIPSPKIRVVGKGLESLQTGLDEWEKGVSGVKIVVEL
ncbi:hypothetical protein CVT25_003514 [Psilocybe cyanescens]|uniref:Enoyl reductase (ER) domain-containing protein n=1 Tax=Psilocybe cyanescens TaxID=93625 RepID=A0A409WP30_PSICY|nr:hypothetical protein CVT25_003514 [Psilocybe cyanescens]